MKDLTLSARLAMADRNPDSQEARIKGKHCRRLNFGDDANDDSLPSKEEIERKFAEEMDKHQKEKQAKWNFDFKQGRPLEGRWEWERLDSNNEVTNARNTGNSSRAAAPGNSDARSGRAQGDAANQAP
ncbi:cyclin-dependent kinase inhibitor 1B isoform X1 [Nasonia vitripennis]|uniref:Cyclin-dependent kinase inhibitor domain-containing protein n=2 Tax=Nasonia vitripennis TaxID=7425 RepID=A0A7M7GIY4_NASVI|nr:cyclin-dependent kinase inhibitor 1B isoform X1 [Nasonia vitripennis]